MRRVLNGDSTVPVMEHHARLVFLAPFGGDWIYPTGIQVPIVGVADIFSDVAN